MLPRRQRRHLRWIAQRSPVTATLALEPGQRLLVFGDTHLDAQRQSRVWSSLPRFLAKLDATRTAGVVCLGDLFEYYLGRKHLRSPIGEVLEWFAELAGRGVRVWMVPGNRDFLIGEEFQRRGIIVCRHGLRLDLHAAGSDAVTALSIVHGDELLVGHWGARVWARLSRIEVARRVTAMAPVFLLDRLAQWMRHQSRRRRQRRASPHVDRFRELPQVRAEVAAALLARMRRGPQGTDVSRWLVSGHFHVPRIERLDSGTLMTLGEWDGLGGVIASFDVEPASSNVMGRLLHDSLAVAH